MNYQCPIILNCKVFRTSEECMISKTNYDLNLWYSYKWSLGIEVLVYIKDI